MSKHKNHTDAKKSALKGLKEKMSALGGESMNGYKTSHKEKSSHNEDGGVVKASVIAKDEEGLKKGLKKAAEMMGQKYEDGGIVSSHEEMSEHNKSSHEMSEHGDYDELSKEELIKLLKNK